MDMNGEGGAKLEAASKAYQEQADVLSRLRAKGASCDADAIREAQTRLRALKKELDSAIKMNGVTAKPGTSFDRDGVEALARKRFFWNPSFDIYGSVGGLYDYGPPGCAVKNNVLSTWRRHFIVEENMLEIEGTCLTMAPVLQASGHVDKFTDLMVKDKVTGQCYRADHVLKDHLTKLLTDEDDPLSEDEKREITALREKVDELSAEQIDAEFDKWKVKAPDSGNDLSKAYPFKLMFSTQIGPSGTKPGYLRPETAQGIFVNFKRLLDYQGGKLPFACAQVGLAFRNEISPRSGLLRVREFQQAEIEHFVHPDHKDHPKFCGIEDLVVTLYGRRQQVSTFKPIKESLGNAVKDGIIDNETLAYFIGRTHQFCKTIGMKMEHVRFRQHLEHEMAHYAKDCWDLEIETSYGWVECAGLADRACFDLKNHSEQNLQKQSLVAREVFEEKKYETVLRVRPVKGIIGRTFRKEAAPLMKALEDHNQEEAEAFKEDLQRDGASTITVEGKKFEVKKEMVTFESERLAITGRNYYPSVVEPSFGIGRLLVALFEHTYYVREESKDESAKGDSPDRQVLALPSRIAPVKCAVFPISKSEQFDATVKSIGEQLGKAGLIHRIDDSGVSIGKRYSRTDELGTPYGITVDFESLKDGSVTLRERDSCKQVRCSIEECVDAVKEIVGGKTTWKEVQGRYPSFDASDNSKAERA